MWSLYSPSVYITRIAFIAVTASIKVCVFCVFQPIKDGELPPLDAMDSILPEYQYIFVDPDGKKRIVPESEYDLL